MYVCNVGIMFVCSSDQGRTVIPTVKSFIKLINQIKSNQSTKVRNVVHIRFAYNMCAELECFIPSNFTAASIKR